ncbi:MAG TPA: glycoside hydrolase family 76 protein [Gaiellaceae bacterium]|nr:glycoside hydrolase family 76 protein [Gaiellaceae bacterium]
MRRGVVLAAALAVVLVVPAATADSSRAPAGRNAQRALAAYETLLRTPRDGHAWPESQALAAKLLAARLPRAPRRVARDAADSLRRIERFRKGPVYAASPGGSVYWDDNEWLAQDLLLAGDVAAARRIFRAVVTAWDDDGGKPCAGGVQWTEARGNDDRNTVSTVNGALVGLELYARTKSPSALAWSRKMLSWVDRCMLAGDGLTWDHIDGAGRVDRTHWTYNQGSLIGALLVLSRTTHDEGALGRAEQLADRSLAYFDARRLAAEPPEFAAIFFRNLLRLAAVDGREDYVAAAQAYADRLWARRRSLSGQLQRAALVQVYAALAAPTGAA